MVVAVMEDSTMAMGKRERQRQEELWIAATEMPAPPGHPFYRKLNHLLAEHGFDAFVEGLCQKFYAEVMGRPSIPPGIYFRMLLIGYFEGIDSERGIAWRCADSLALRAFLGYDLNERTPEHSSLSVIRGRIEVETHREVFQLVLKVLAKSDLLQGKTLGIDATTLEANAALRSIVRRDTGQRYEEFLTDLAKASGIESPTREDLVRLDRKRPKKGSNQQWRHPHDPDAKITKMKDGRTHLAHKAEHAVDLETGAIVAVTLQGADQGDTTTISRQVSTSRAIRSKRWWRTRATTATRRYGHYGRRRFARTYPNPNTKAGVTGRTRRPSKRRCTPTGGEFAAGGARRCCEDAASWWSGRSLIVTRPAGCVAPT
jgi:transposase